MFVTVNRHISMYVHRLKIIETIRMAFPISYVAVKGICSLCH